MNKINKWQQEYRKKNKIKINLYRKELREKYIKSWLPYLPQQPKCEVCSKSLKYFSRQRNQIVHFDHKTDKIPIKTIPNQWLIHHKPTLENIKIWKNCNFGILCSYCNEFLPTKNRKKWLQQITKYISKDG